LGEELRAHRERATEEYVAKAMAPEEARRRARLELGGMEKVKEECREARKVNWIQDFLQVLRYRLAAENERAALASLCEAEAAAIGPVDLLRKRGVRVVWRRLPAATNRDFLIYYRDRRRTIPLIARLGDSVTGPPGAVIQTIEPMIRTQIARNSKLYKSITCNDFSADTVRSTPNQFTSRAA